jgi:hypothetical protein
LALSIRRKEMKERKSDVEAEERNNIRKKKLFIGNLISLTIQGQK